MKLGLAVGFACVCIQSSAEIRITVLQPSPGELSDDNLFISATVASTFELASVTASVEGREAKLVFTASAIPGRFGATPGWTNSLSLAGLSRGPFNLAVTAKDVLGSSSATQVSFTHDRKPVLVVASPTPNAVARPTVAVDFACSDDGPTPCAVRILANGQLLATNQVNALDLSAFDHSGVALRFEVKDSAGQTTIDERGVFVETNPQLSEVLSVTGNFWDVQPDRILFLDGTRILKIRDRSSGRETVILNDKDKVAEYGFLAPKGAMFVASGTVFDWRDGKLVDLGLLNSQNSLVVNGGYAIWNVNFVFQDLMLRDLVAGTNVIVSRKTGNWHNDVATNGDVVFWGNDYKIYRYRRGVTTLVSTDSTVWNTYPVTDGTNVVYRKHGNGTFAIIMVSATGESMLVPALAGDATPGADYQLNSGWVAYRKPGTGGPLQVWTRSPGGAETQITYFGSSSGIESLNPNGELIVSNGGTKYLSQAGRPLLALGPYIGETAWRDGRWTVVIGGSLFALAPADVIQNISVRSGLITFSVRTVSTKPVVIQASTDLVNWQTMATVTPSAGVAQFSEPKFTGSSLRFYRTAFP